MAYYLSSSDLIKSVKRRANIPDAQSMITDDEILDFANEEMMLNLVPLVVSKHEDYYLTEERIATELNKLKYQIPYRALGNKMQELAFFVEEGSYVEMHRVPLDEILDASGQGGRGNRFYIQNESVVIQSNDSHLSYDTLSFFYNMRPNMLVDSSRVAKITNIDRESGNILVDSLPDNFTSASLVDFVKQNSPHRILDYDVAISVLDTSNGFFTFAVGDIPEELVVGDRICLQNETDLVNAPSELHVMLAEMVAGRVLEAIGDSEGLQNVNKKLQRMEKSTEYLIDNRVTGSPMKARPRNGLLKGRGSKRFNR